MSDGNVNNQHGATQDPAEQALEHLYAGWEQHAEVGAEVREYLEVLALLGNDVDEVEPSPVVKEGLFAQIAGSSPSPMPTEVVAFPRPAAKPRQPAWLVPALAAGLALCLLGLGYFYGQLTSLEGRLLSQADRLAEQDAQVAESETLQLRLIETQRELADLHERLAMVDTIAQTAYPLRPASVGGQPINVSSDGPLPDGRVYVCGQHQRWYLTAQHLEPAPADQEYHLWFMTEGGAVDAGVVEVSGAGSALLRNLTMPKGTHGFTITLEVVGTEDGEPHGPTILRGDQPVKL